jgi:ferredoxin
VVDAWALPEINLVRCNGCGLCVDHCPTCCVEMVDERPSFVRPMDCTYCGECESQCPERAIECTYVIEWGQSLGESPAES